MIKITIEMLKLGILMLKLGILGENMLKIAICDDEPIILDRINDIIKAEFNRHNVKVHIHLYERGEDIINSIDVSDYDVIFLDIELKTTNGLDIAQMLRQTSYNNLIVFITSFVNYALDGYKATAFRFILKDDMDNLLPECIDAICKSLQCHRYKDSDTDIKVNDILYVMSDNRTIDIYFKDGTKKTMYTKLNDFEQQMNSQFLYRVHQSYLVNIVYVEFIVRYHANLIDGTHIPISKSRYKDAVKDIMLRRALWS